MKPRPERTKTETKAEKRGRNENGTVRSGVVRAVRISYVSLGFLFIPCGRFSISASNTARSILGPCHQTSPFGFKLSGPFRTESIVSSYRGQTKYDGDEIAC